jgi:arginine repressor
MISEQRISRQVEIVAKLEQDGHKQMAGNR